MHDPNDSLPTLVVPHPFEPTPRERLINRNNNRSFTLRYRIAERRSRKLLRSFLSVKQWECWQERHYLRVQSPDGQRTYFIREGRAFNVTLMQCDKPLPGMDMYTMRPWDRLCGVIEDRGRAIPIYDIVLAQYLAITGGAEEEFIQRAEITHAIPCH